MDINQLYQLYSQYPAVQTDSRKVVNGEIYFALKGANFNGNLFAKNALENGAVYCVVDEDSGMVDQRCIKVPDVLAALQALSKKHREQFSIPFIAITGSNGKTTTKELVHAVLSQKFKTYTTEGNLNNHIGIPLTLLKIKKDAEMAVIEMGANHQKEIEGYCKYVMPTHGLITNCGKAHLEGFGGEEGVRKGKGELFDYIRANNGTLFLFKDYDYFDSMIQGYTKIVSYASINNTADVVGRITDDQQFLEVEVTKGMNQGIRTQLVGGYNLPNILAAACIGKYFDVSSEKIKEAIELYHPTNSRSQLIKKGSNSIVLDAYNANPSSMKVAIENFAKRPGIHKIIFIGGMMELGEESEKEHKELVGLINKYAWSKVILVGDQFKSLCGPHYFFQNVSEAREWFLSMNVNNSEILIKGSRSMQMEKLLE